MFTYNLVHTFEVKNWDQLTDNQMVLIFHVFWKAIDLSNDSERKHQMTFISRITFSHLVFQECRACAAWPMLAKISSVQFSSAWSCPALCNPIDYSMPGLPVLVEDNSRSLLRLMSIALVMPSNHLILCHLLLLLPSIFPSIRVFSNDPALCIRFLK